MPSLKLDVSGLKRLAGSLGSKVIEDEIMQIPKRKAVAALVGQAIDDNFDKQGPGWKPLSSATIRQSIARHGRKRTGSGAARMILQDTGLLKKTATTPYASGSRKSGKKTITGKNVYRVEGTMLIWGTDLVYAGIHNNGGVIQRTNKKTGRVTRIQIPKREFLKLSEIWKERIRDYMILETFKVVVSRVTRGEA